MAENQPPDDFRSTCLKWQDGWLQFDAVPSEDVMLEALVTDFPVEPGAGPNLTDHVQMQPVEFSLETIVSNMPTVQPLTHHDGQEPVDADVTVVLKRPLVPDGLGPVSGLANQTSRAISSVTGGTASLERREVVNLDVQTFDPPLRRVTNAYEELVQIMREARLLKVSISELADFDDCIIKSLQRRRGLRTGSSALNVTIGLVQVQLSQTQGQVQAVPAQPSGQRKKAGGRKQAKEAEEKKDEKQAESVLHSLVN